MMPAGGGLRVAERLRAIGATATVPIIFLTASRDQELRDRAMAFGPHAFIQKPYDPEALIAAVKSALGIVEAPRDLHGTAPVETP
jgi:CheY-like chemotaxis protein